MSKQTIPASDEAWDDRTLGAEEEFVRTVEEAEEAVADEAACLQLMSIRLQKSLIEDFKLIAALNGHIGYQTLMRQILQRFVDSEKARILRELVSEKLKDQSKSTEAFESPKPKPRQRKAA